MANRRFIDFPIASTVGDNDIVLIWQDGLNKQTTKGTLIQGVPTSLEDLTDVDIAGLINGQILQYNSVTGKWENVDRTDIDLDELGDVTIVSPSNGQVLIYNSSTSKWENSSIIGGFVPYTGATADVDLGTHELTAERGTFENNGSSNTLTVNHTSGSGYGIIVTKGGNNEALYVNKTSGSGNAMTVVGGRTSLVDLSLSSVSNATGNFLTISGGVVHQRTAAQTLTDIGGQAALTNPVTGTGTSGQVAYFNGTTTITSESNLFWDATNDRLGIGTASPVYNLDLLASSSANSDIFRAGMTGVSNGFTVQRVSSSFTYTFLNGHLLIGNSANSGQQLQVTGTAKITDILTIGTTDNSFIYESGGSLILQTGASADLVIPSSGASTFNSGLNVVGDLTLSSANPFLYGGTAAGSLGLSNIGGESYIRVFGASHSTTPNVTQFVNAGSTSLTIASTGAAAFSGSVSTPHTTKTADYTLTATDYTVGFDCASNRTATLPDATTCAGRIYVIYQYNTGSGARSVTLDGNGSQTINGVTTYSLSPFCEYTSVMIQSNGANWIIISSNFTTDCL